MLQHQQNYVEKKAVKSRKGKHIKDRYASHKHINLQIKKTTHATKFQNNI